MEKTVLSNGLRILWEPMTAARSTAVELLVAAGSRFESAEQQGISHFCEHMLFKGTDSRSARRISEDADLLGATLDAYTYKEYTRFCAQVIPENAVACMEILLDMLLHSRVEQQQTELERRVILDEMDMYDDIGDELAHDAICRTAYPAFSIGSPICGTKESVSHLTSEELRQYIRSCYTPERMVAVIAGKFDRAAMEALLCRTLGALPRGDGMPVADYPVFTPGRCLITKDFSQLSMEWAWQGIPAGDARRHALLLLNILVGGGASSRLFSRLREELGLVYSVDSHHDESLHSGLFTVSAAVSPTCAKQVMQEVPNILRRIADEGITDEEFQRAHALARSSYIFDLETVSDIADYIGYNEMIYQRNLPVSDVLAALDAVRPQDICALARTLFTAPFAFSAVGAVDALANE